MISPLLANIYLHELDLRWHRLGGPRDLYNAQLVRYADDFVVLARQMGPPILEFVRGLLETKMELELNASKTRILNLGTPGESLDFLGYTFRFDRDLKGRGFRYLNMFPSKKSQAKMRLQLRYLTRRGNMTGIWDLVPEVNSKLLGWGRYFGKGYPAVAFARMDWYVQVRFERFARTRSQRRMRVPHGKTLYSWLQSLGLVRLSTLPKDRMKAFGSHQGFGKAGCGKSARPV